MGERELREKYGGKLPKAINRAIRAEIPGGNEALDRLTDLAAAAKHSHWHDKQGRPTPEAEAYYKHQRNVVARMDEQVRKTWGVPVRSEERRVGKEGRARRAPEDQDKKNTKGQKKKGEGRTARES